MKPTISYKIIEDWDMYHNCTTYNIAMVLAMNGASVMVLKTENGVQRTGAGSTNSTPFSIVYHMVKYFILNEANVEKVEKMMQFYPRNGSTYFTLYGQQFVCNVDVVSTFLIEIISMNVCTPDVVTAALFMLKT